MIDKNWRLNIGTFSPKQIRDKIIEVHKLDNPSEFWRSLHAYKLLPYVIPELVDAIGQGGGEHHAETVWEHLLATLEASCPLSDNPMLRLACFLHDVGKPRVVSNGEDGRIHFYKHEVAGASIVYKWMMDMKFSSKDAKYVSNLIRHHQFRFDSKSKEKTIRRWLQAVGPSWRDLMILRCADRKGNFANKNKPMITAQMRQLINKADEILNKGTPIFTEDLIINSKDLKNLGIKDNSIHKEIFINLLGIVYNDPTKNTKEWLLNYVKQQYMKTK